LISQRSPHLGRPQQVPLLPQLLCQLHQAALVATARQRQGRKKRWRNDPQMMEKDGTNGTNMGKDGKHGGKRWKTHGKRCEMMETRLKNMGNRWEHMCKTVVLDPVKKENLLSRSRKRLLMANLKEHERLG
jgi:hypothetical protein